MVPADLQRRLGNRGVSVAVRRRAAGAADPSAVGSSAPPDDITSERATRATRVLENAGLDADTRAAALEAAADPTVNRVPVGDNRSDESELSATPDADETGPNETGPDETGPDREAPDVNGSGDVEADEGAVDEDGGSPDQPEPTGRVASGNEGPDAARGTGTDAGTDAEQRAPAVADTGAGELATGDLVLIDVELAEHQRWSGAQGRVGAVASEQRAEFIAEAVGGGFAAGVASGAKMGLGMGLATRLMPGIGPALGGAMALHGLVGRDWAETRATVAKFGEGNDDYETLANSIAAVSAVIDTVSQVLTVVNGIVGIVQTAAEVIAGGAVVAAFFTFGATLGIAAVAADVAATCEEISLAITAVTTALDGINNAILQPCVVLFRALHTFTAQADPRDVEAQGRSLSLAAETSGAALGGWIGGKAAHAGSGARPPAEEPPPSRKPEPELPPPASGDGPTVRFNEPVSAGPAAEPVTPAAAAEPVTPVPAAEPVAPAAGAEPVTPVTGAEPVTPVPAAEPVTPAAAAEPVTPVPAAEPVAPAAGAEPVTPVTGAEPVTPVPAAEPVTPAAAAEPVTPVPAAEPVTSATAAEPVTPAAEVQSVAPVLEPVSSPNAPETAPGLSPIPAGPSFADLNPVVDELSGSPFGDRLAAQAVAPMQDVPRETSRTPQAVHDAAYRGIQTERPEGWDPVQSLQDQHWTKVKDATIKAAPGTLPATVEAINANRSPLQTSKGGESSLLLTTQGVPDSQLPTGSRRTRFFVAEEGEGPMGRPAVAKAPGIAELPPEPGAAGGPKREANYNAEHRFADRYLIPDVARRIQAARKDAGLPPLDDVQLAVAAGEQARYVMEGVPRTDLAQNPVRPWSGEVIQRPRSPMQMLLAPEVLSPELHAKGRTVDAPPPPEPEAAPNEFIAPNPNQLSLDFSVSPAAGSNPTPAAPPETSSVGHAAPQSATPAAAAPVRPESAPTGKGGGPLPTSAVVAATGTGTAMSPRAQQEAADRARFTGDNQPAEGVERVNPQYPPPPGTHAQIVAMQNEIMNLLTVRASAEQEAEREGERVDRCVDNQGPIARTVADTTAGISAVQAHDAAVARRAEVNAEQQQRQQESQSLAAGYPSRAAGFAALTIPLRAWEGFTSLASHLPGRAGAEMLRLNAEAQQLQEAFGQMAAKMLGVDSAAPSDAQRLQDDQARLQTTGEDARQSDRQLLTASAGAQGLQQANEEALGEATDRRDTSTDRAQECVDAAQARESQANTLAERLRAWAGQHAEARRQAIAETTNRLRREGRTILGSSER